MNSRNIKSHLHKVITDWFESYKNSIASRIDQCYSFNINPSENIEDDENILFGLDMYDNFIKKINDSIIVSGGCIVSLYLNEEVNDYDIYLTDKSVAESLINFYLLDFNKRNGTEWFYSQKFNCFYKFKNIKKNITSDELDEKFLEYVETSKILINVAHIPSNQKYIPISISPNAITLTGKIQIITRFTGTPEEIISNFDFIHTNNYYIFKNNELVLNLDTLDSILSKKLIYNGSKFPIASLLRLKKFINRGWDISLTDLLKIAIQINKLNLSDLTVLTEQLIGIYGSSAINCLNEFNTENFDLNTFLNHLNNFSKQEKTDLLF